MTTQELLANGLEKVSQAAKRLGIDRNTMYRWIHEGKIPYLHIHDVYRIPSRAIDDMLAGCLNIGSCCTPDNTQEQTKTPGHRGPGA